MTGGTTGLTTRILPVAEWPRLAGTLLETVWPTLDPRTTQILVVEAGDRLVGCWALLALWHLEGCWIDPARRGRAGVARAGLRAMRALLAAAGIGEVLMMATNPGSQALCQKLGTVTPLACAHYAVRLTPGGSMEGP
jgi:hypothetical protein